MKMLRYLSFSVMALAVVAWQASTVSAETTTVYCDEPVGPANHGVVIFNVEGSNCENICGYYCAECEGGEVGYTTDICAPPDLVTCGCGWLEE